MTTKPDGSPWPPKTGCTNCNKPSFNTSPPPAYLDPRIIHDAGDNSAAIRKVQEQAMQDNKVPKEMPMLHKAHSLIHGQRQKDYGDKLPNFSQIADFWTAHLKFKLAPGVALSPEDVALMMINVKQARLAKSPIHYDSILDIAGYAGCYDAIQNERAKDQEARDLQLPPYDKKK
jgi:hypothetical protein